MSDTPRPVLGSPGLQSILRSAARKAARIRGTQDGARIDFSDGCSVTLYREPHVSSDAFMAAVVQWTRRRGAASIEIDGA